MRETGAPSIITVTGANNNRDFDINANLIMWYEPVIPQDIKMVSTSTVIILLGGAQVMVKDSVEGIRAKIARAASSGDILEFSTKGQA